MFGIGAGEFILILIVGLIVFGPGKLPEVGRALGKALREFRKAQAAFSNVLEESAKEPEKKSSAEKKSPPEESSDKKVAAEKISTEKHPYDEKISVDDVINLAKQNPISKEQNNEENLNLGVADSGAANDKRNEPARGGADGVGQQSEPAKN